MTPQEKIKHYVNLNKTNIVKILYSKYGKEAFENKTGDDNLFFELSTSNCISKKSEIGQAISMIDFLIKQGFNINEHHLTGGETPLFYFVSATPQVLKHVIKNIDNINALNDDNENTLLSFIDLSSQSKIENLEILIQEGSNINQQNLEGKTLLMKAAKQLNHSLVDLLVKYDVDTNLKDKNENTALHYAVNQAVFFESIQGKTIASLMKSNTIDINAKDKQGNTALKIACSKENEESISELLKHGASIFIENKQGKKITVLDFIENKSFAFKDKKNQMIDLVKPFCERELIKSNSVLKKNKTSKIL